MDEAAVVLFSGGTDSTCAAALMAESFRTLHLLTFERRGFHHVEHAGHGARHLQECLPTHQVFHRYVRIERLFRHLAFVSYPRRAWRFGFSMLGNCTFCALANHVRAIAYCLQHGISHVADGVTRELPTLPSHMEKPIARLRDLYARYGLTYHTPVYDFDIPREMSFLDRLFLPDDGRSGLEVDPGLRTTGRYLHERGWMPVANIKGSALDRSYQYRCFQYVLHNMVALCAWKATGPGQAPYERRILDLYDDSIERITPLLDQLRDGGNPETQRLFDEGTRT